MKEAHWEVYCLMDDYLLDEIEPSDARQPVKFSHEFLRGNMIEHASVGQLRKIIGCLQHNADRRATTFDLFDANFGDVFLDTTEKLDFLRGLSIQTLAIEVCEEELNRRRLKVGCWRARDSILKTLDRHNRDWRRQARNATSAPLEFSGADAHRARGMGVLLD